MPGRVARTLGNIPLFGVVGQEILEYFFIGARDLLERRYERARGLYLGLAGDAVALGFGIGGGGGGGVRVAAGEGGDGDEDDGGGGALVLLDVEGAGCCCCGWC